MFSAVLLILLFVCLFSLPRIWSGSVLVASTCIPATPIHIWIRWYAGLRCGANAKQRESRNRFKRNSISMLWKICTAAEERVRVYTHPRNSVRGDTKKTAFDYYCFSWVCFIDEMLAINFESYTKVFVSIWVCVWVCTSRYYIHKRFGLRRICTP